MDDRVLQIIVLAVLGAATMLMLLTVATRLLDELRRRRLDRHLEVCRSQALRFVVEGTTPQCRTPAERRLTMELLLSYQALLRGREADAISEYLEDSGYVEEQIGELRARRAWKRARAADALGRARSPGAVPALIAALADSDDDVRIVAARSLAAIGTEPAARAIAEVLADPERPAPAMIIDDLVLVGRLALPVLLQVAAGDDPVAATTAVRILGEIRDPGAAMTLVGLLHSAEGVDLRAQAAAALGKIGGRMSIVALGEALDDKAWEVRAQAAKALGRIGDPRAVPGLEAAMPDQSWWVRLNCGEALAALGAPGAKALDRLTRSPDRYVADQAASMLAALRRRRLAAVPGAPSTADHGDGPLPVRSPSVAAS